METAAIALQSAASGLSALSTKLDVVANNLANVNTEGFKASRANFQDLLYVEREQPGVETATGDQRPTGLYIGLGVKVSGTQAPAGVTVTDALCATGAEAASATLTQALKDAHMKSGTYAQEKMAGLYSEMGLTQGMAGMQ